MARLLREPLLHFTLAAALIFLLYSLFAPGGRDGERTILVSEAELERMAALYASESGALPGPDDMQAMLADHVETAALAREARRLGLDQGDTVVERRLAQKMRFMVDDLTAVEEPGEDTLRAWYETHTDRFAVPARYSFDHVFFREADETRIEAAKIALSEDPQTWRALGDPFMLQRQYGELPLREIVRLFGPDFATSLEALDPEGGWQGPVRSAFGAHLLRLTAVMPARLPEFENVRDSVERDWREAARRRANAGAVAEIVARYDVEIAGETR